MKHLLLICFSALTLSSFGWETLGRIEALEEEHSVLCSPSINHGAPILHLSLRNLHDGERTLQLVAKVSRCATAIKTVNLGPGATASVSFPMVFVSEYDRNYYDRDIQITESKPPKGVRHLSDYPATIDYEKHFNYADAYGTHSEEISLLLSSGISPEQLKATLSSALGIKDDEGKLKPFTCNTSPAPDNLSQWPRDYRAYMTFDAVLAPSSVFQALPEDVRLALAAFKRLGGELIVTEEDTPGAFASLPDARAAHDRFQAARTRLVGDCKLKSYGHPPQTAQNAERIPLKIDATLPAGSIILMLIVFSCVCIPVAVFLCARKNKRLQLLIILPGFAFALSLIVVLIALYTYGMTPTLRLQSVTFLDQTTRLAVTRGQFGIFSPVSVNDELSVPSDATLAWRDTNNERFPGSVSYDDAIRLNGTWIKPLTAAFFDFTRANLRAEKLDVRLGTNGCLVVANLLGAPITGGWLRRGKKHYPIPALAAGEQVELSDGDADKPLFRTDFDSRLFSAETDFGRSWGKTVLLLDSPSLPDNSYSLRLVGSPFFPSPFGTRKTKATCESIVLGTFAEDLK